MKPPQAIEILNKDLTYTYPATFNELKEAIQLGKEALIYIVRLRTYSREHRQACLPSEDNIPYNPAAEAYLRHIKESPLGKKPGP